MISEVGLRYEPSAQADLQAHAVRVTLLAGDLADLDPRQLQAAIARWVSVKPYLPKASELRAIAENMAAERSPPSDPAQMAAEMNDRLRRRDPRRAEAIEWFATAAGDVRLRDREPERRDTRPYRPSPEEAAATHAVIADLVAQGVEKPEFDRLQRAGTLDQMIAARLRQHRPAAGSGEA